MNDQLRAIAELDRVIHEPGRMMIVALLAAVVECDFLYLLRETELNKGNLSSHLSKLEDSGYVKIEKTYNGKVPQTLLRLSPHGRAAFEEYRKRLNMALVQQLKTPSIAGRTRRSRDQQMSPSNPLRNPTTLGEAV